MISADLPGADLMVAGLADLAGGRTDTIAALLYNALVQRLVKRSPWVAIEGQLTIRHYDPTAQALAKLSRGHHKISGMS